MRRAPISFASLAVSALLSSIALADDPPISAPAPPGTPPDPPPPLTHPALPPSVDPAPAPQVLPPPPPAVVQAAPSPPSLYPMDDAHPPRQPDRGRRAADDDALPLAGFHGGRFYLRDSGDNFRLYVGGRIHLDSYNYFGAGVSDTALKSTFLLRRARVELSGEIMKHWTWLMQGEFAPTEFDNADGRNEQFAAPAGVEPTAGTAQYAAVQAPRYRAQPVQVWANYEAAPILNVQVGQFNLPFTMDNRTSTNTMSFLDRSLAVRTWGMPEVRDPGASLWGYLEKRVFYYSVGVFNGDGYNRPNADNRFLAAVRIYTRPLARSKGPLEKLQIGVSAKYGMHDKNRVAYDVKPMTTQSGYQFWSSTYTDSAGRRTHIIPSGAETALAGELRVPFGPLDLRSEFVYAKNNTREAVDGYQLTNTERLGTMKGYGYYVQVGYWLLGSPKITGDPGDQGPAKVDLHKPDPGVPPQGVEVALRWEQLNINYAGAARNGDQDSKNVDGDISVNAMSAGINYWASRHLRVSLDYVLDMFPDSAPKSATVKGGPTWTSSQRALAPGNTLGKGVNDDARDNAHTLHEVSARIGVAF